MLTQVELEELQRDPIPQGTPNLVAEENDHQLGANIMQQLNDTEMLMETPHMLTPKQLELKDKLLKQMEHSIRLPILKDAPKKYLAQIIQNINNILTTIGTTSIGAANNLNYSTVLLVIEESEYEVKCKARIPKESSQWKIRLENKVVYMRNAISCLEHLKIGTLRNTKIRERRIKKYHMEVKTIAEIVEVFKQRVTLTIKKIEWYEARCQQFKQNRQFNLNQRRFNQNLEEGNNYSIEIPDKEKTSKFWKTTGKIQRT